jgi:hypothetical protein
MAKRLSVFQENMRRGRHFEAAERKGWRHFAKEHRHYEAVTAWASRRGRIDIKIDEHDGVVAIVEIKATDWDALKRASIGRTAQRHVRQVWRYINDHVENQAKEVCAGVVYKHEPKNRETRFRVEQILNDRFIQVAWRKERLGRQK